MLITDTNVSAEGALSVAWKHHLPVSNVLYIISPPPHVSSVLFSCWLMVMKISRKRDTWEPASLLSSDNKSRTQNTGSPKDDVQAFMFGLMTLLFFSWSRYGIWHVDIVHVLFSMPLYILTNFCYYDMQKSHSQRKQTFFASTNLCSPHSMFLPGCITFLYCAKFYIQLGP